MFAQLLPLSLWRAAVLERGACHRLGPAVVPPPLGEDGCEQSCQVRVPWAGSLAEECVEEYSSDGLSLDLLLTTFLLKGLEGRLFTDRLQREAGPVFLFPLRPAPLALTLLAGRGS